MFKVILTLTILALFSIASAAPSEESPSTLWGAWKLAHNKHYIAFEESHRFAIFQNNVAKIAKLNAENPDTKFAINKFADLTSAEFKKKHVNGLISRRVSNQKESHTELIMENLPSSIDWRTQGAVTLVKDQGSCGSCWAFSAVGAIEGLYKIKGGALTDFSAQQLVDCSTTYGNEGCYGGEMYLAFQYVAHNGLEKETDYPYTAQDQACKHTPGKTAIVIKKYIDVPANDSNKLKAALAFGPVSVALDSDSLVFQFYSKGVLSSPSCGTELNHAALAVGYGTENNQDFFIVKNSWGPSWGDKGYVKILAESKPGPGICGINMMASYPM